MTILSWPQYMITVHSIIRHDNNIITITSNKKYWYPCQWFIHSAHNDYFFIKKHVIMLRIIEIMVHIDRSCDHSELSQTRTVSTGSWITSRDFSSAWARRLFVGRSLLLPCSHHTDPLAAWGQREEHVNKALVMINTRKLQQLYKKGTKLYKVHACVITGWWSFMQQ